MGRQSWLICMVAVTIVIGVSSDISWRLASRPRYSVWVAGQLVGGVRRASEADRALRAVEELVTPDMRVQVDLTDKMAVRPLVKGERIPSVQNEVIQTALIRTIPSLTYATAITVNGRDVVAVKDEATAGEVRDTILAEYKSTVLRDVTAVDQLEFQEKIDWHPKLVRTENVRTPEEAIKILKYGTDKLVQYVVQEGDTGWGIARTYQVSPEDLAKANPTADIETLQIGQVLNVTFRDPWVHTHSVSRRVVNEPIPFTEEIDPDPNLWPWQYEVTTPGVTGSRELVLRETRENGLLVKTEVIASKVLSEPKRQTARQGTKQIPALGTGSLVYPVVGVITSYFGPRWGTYHYGLDIGVPTGTPVLAADDGMVVFAGWSGNYGELLEIDHGGGQRTTWYAHLSSFGVSVGDTVHKGQVIAYSGDTGYSTGPHLHFEVHENGEAVDPLSFYK